MATARACEPGGERPQDGRREWRREVGQLATLLWARGALDREVARSGGVAATMRGYALLRTALDVLVEDALAAISASREVAEGEEGAR